MPLTTTTPASTTSPSASGGATRDSIDDTTASAESLWQDFFALHQLGNGQTDGAGGCALQLDGLSALVRCWPDDGLLAVQLQVATLPTAPGPRAALCEALLVQALDLIEGDVAGIDTASGAAVYQRLLAIDGLDATALTAELWDMADAVTDLRALLPQAA